MNKASSASPIVDEMVAFCDEETAALARAAVEAMQSYAAQWLLFVGIDDETQQARLESNVHSEGARYRRAFESYQAAVRSHP